jgi:integrase
MLNDMRYWAPVVALYTGARAGELGGLRLEEVRLDDPAPHILIRCNRYRNTKSRMDRHVPILDALVKLGFRDYVARVRATGTDRVFPDWQLPPSRGADTELFNWANTKWIRAFNRTVIPSALPHVASAGGRSPLVFHSLRGAFKVLLLNSGPRHLANAVLGHLQDDYDKAYVGLVTPEETYAAFRSANYVGLTLATRAVSAPNLAA